MKNKNIDIHNLSGKLARINIRIADMDIPDADRAAILNFRNKNVADGLGVARILKYMQLLKRMYEISDCSILEADSQDIISLLARIELSGLSDWSKYDYKVGLRKYLRFCQRPDLADLIRIQSVDQLKLPEELLGTGDIHNMMMNCTRDEDRALIALLWESGCRIGELLGIMRRHVEMDAMGAVVVLNGKTGMRRIRLIESAPYLDIWISSQSPKPDDRIFPLSYPTTKKRIKTIAVRAEIPKRIYPHIFRHSRATFLAQYFTEAQMCHYLGWKIGSKMPRIYVHLSGADLDPTLSTLPSVLPTPRQIKNAVYQTDLESWR